MPSAKSLTERNVLELQNKFTKEQYPPDEQTNLSTVPLEDIYAELAHAFPDGYTIEVVQAGCTNSGEYYAVVSVELPLGNGNWLKVPGASSGSIGMAGILTNAIRNAFLRHVGMGTGLYEHDDEHPPQFENNHSTPASPFTAGDQHGGYAEPARTGNGSFNRGGNSGGQAFGPWTGEVVIKSGGFQGLKWSQLPDDTIESMAGKGNNLAQKELQRRRQR